MSNDNQSNYIDELKANRNGLQDLLSEIVDVRKDIKDIIPTTKEFNKRFVLENRMKTISDIVSSELSIRKQIDSSIKTEFDLYNKSARDADDIDARTVAEGIELAESRKRKNQRNR